MSAIKQRIAALQLKRDADLAAASTSSRPPDPALSNGAANGAETIGQTGYSPVTMIPIKSDANLADEVGHVSVAASNVSDGLRKNVATVEQKIGTSAKTDVKAERSADDMAAAGAKATTAGAKAAAEAKDAVEAKSAVETETAARAAVTAKTALEVNAAVEAKASAEAKVAVEAKAVASTKTADGAYRVPDVADATLQLAQSLGYIVELEEYIQQLERDRQVMVNEVSKYELDMEERCRSLQDEIAFLTQERDALVVRCTLFEGIEKEKVALDERCKSLQGDVMNLTQERDALGMQRVLFEGIHKQKVAVDERCKSMQGEIAFLTQERDALALQCTLLEGIEREKAALDQRCASLEGEIEMTIQAAVKNEEIYRTKMHQRFQSLLRENEISQKLLQDEQRERIQVQTLLSDFEAEFADEVFKKSQEIEVLRAEIDKLVRSTADLNERNFQLSQLFKSSEENAASVSATSRMETEALTETLSDLRASLEMLQNLNNNLSNEKAQLISEKDALSAELSHLRGEKNYLQARFDSLSDELLLISNPHEDQVRHTEALDSQHNASTQQQLELESQLNSNLSPASSIISRLKNSGPSLKLQSPAPIPNDNDGLLSTETRTSPVDRMRNIMDDFKRKYPVRSVNSHIRHE